MGYLPVLSQKTLSLQVAESLREAIIQGSLQPGDAVREHDIATQMGVSRAPVREALILLEDEGLVERIAYQGTFVTRLSRRDVEELYSLRATLECFALELLLERDTSELLTQLQQLIEQMAQQADAADAAMVNQLDLAFHDCLMSHAAHRWLDIHWRMLRPHINRVLVLGNNTNDDLHIIAANHQPIILAIQVRDGVKARAILLEHVADSGQRALNHWQQAYGTSDNKEMAQL